MRTKTSTTTEIGHPPHNRRLGLLGVSLTKARLNRDRMAAMKIVRDEIEGLMLASGYLEDAPFWWVTVAIRYGLKYDRKPHYQRINKKYGDLPLAIEVDTHDLVGAPLARVTEIYRRAVLVSLIDAGRKYDRPVERLERELYDAA